MRSLGVWEPGPDVIEEYGRENPYDFMVAPLNVATAEKAAPSFERSKELGWRTFAVSPFIRGWELDKMVERALAKEGGEESAVRARLGGPHAALLALPPARGRARDGHAACRVGHGQRRELAAGSVDR